MFARFTILVALVTITAVGQAQVTTEDDYEFGACKTVTSLD